MGRRMKQQLSVFALLTLAFSLSPSLTSTPAQAEMYVAGQVGVSLPNSLNNIEGTGTFTGLTLSDLSLHNSVMYGAKIGYYFDAMKWLGVETEVFNSTPHIKQQTATVSSPVASVTGTLTGQDLRVLNWAPVNIVARYQMDQFEPYAGIGLGLFFSQAKDGQTGESSSSTDAGLNTQLGARYLVTENLALFGEWKYNRASISFSDSSLLTPSTGGFKGGYSANILAFGLGYHF